MISRLPFDAKFHAVPGRYVARRRLRLLPREQSRRVMMPHCHCA